VFVSTRTEASTERSRGNVFVYHCAPRPLIQGFPGRLERLHEQRACFRIEPPLQHHHTVFVRIHVKRTGPVATGALLRFRVPVYTPPAPDDALDVVGGARPANLEQPLFGRWSSDPGQRADLGVRELAAGQGCRQPVQRPERPRHADALASGAHVEPHAPGEPVGTRAKAAPVPPAAAGVELADEIEQPCRGGVEMSG
jgi:hypothetical protein